MATVTETANQNARTVADQSRVLADETFSTAQQAFNAYQNSYLTLLEASFQATGRWFELGRVVLEQAEAASRESREALTKLAAQSREQQGPALNLARETGRIVQNTWLGVYRNGRTA